MKAPNITLTWSPKMPFVTLSRHFILTQTKLQRQKTMPTKFCHFQSFWPWLTSRELQRLVLGRKVLWTSLTTTTNLFYAAGTVVVGISLSFWHQTIYIYLYTEAGAGVDRFSFSVCHHTTRTCTYSNYYYYNHMENTEDNLQHQQLLQLLCWLWLLHSSWLLLLLPLPPLLLLWLQL